MAAPWDDAARQKFKEYIQLLLGLILGAIVLLPGIVDLAKPPPVFPWFVPAALVLASVSVLCLGFALLAAVFGSRQPPFKLIGIGSWVGFLSLAMLFTYIILNVISELQSTPIIGAVKVSPVAVAAGKYVELDVEASDKSRDRLTYRWISQGREFSTLRNGYLKAPEVPGTYQITVLVSNERTTAQRAVTIEVTPDKSAVTCPSMTPTTTEQVDQNDRNGTKKSNSSKHAQRRKATCPG